jgi:regulator of sigma E protease
MFALEILSYIFWVILAITILVFIHELGHFLFAKLFGMRVERFSVGFPPKIFGRKIGETEYVIGATPLGGYVKISGMVDESMDTEFEGAEPEPHEFRSKPVWQRIIVILAGVVFNILLAFAIFAGLKLSYGDDYVPAANIESVYVPEGSFAYDMGLRTGDRIVAVSGRHLERYNDLLDVEHLMADPMTVSVVRNGDSLTFTGPDDIMTQLNRAGGFGISVHPSLIGSVMRESAAYDAGLRPGDRILAIDGEPITFWLQITEMMQESGGDSLDVTFARAPEDGLIAPRTGVEVETTRLRPRQSDDGRYLLGVTVPSTEMLWEEYGREHEAFGPGGALVAGVNETWVTTKVIVTSLTRVFSGRENFRENVGGPIAIAQVTKQAAEAGAFFFWRIVAMLSITLAVMNILPVPALDGGHLVFLIYEGITRREPSLRVRMVMQQVGMIVLLAFMTFLIFNDILRL